MGGLRILKELPLSHQPVMVTETTARRRCPRQDHQPVRGRARQALCSQTSRTPEGFTEVGGAGGQVNKERKKEGRELAWPKACPKARPGHRPSPLQLWNDCFKGCPVHLGALPPTSSDLVSCPAHRRGLANTGSHVAKSCNRSISSAPSPHRTGGNSHCWTEEGTEAQRGPATHSGSQKLRVLGAGHKSKHSGYQLP